MSKMTENELYFYNEGFLKAMRLVEDILNIHTLSDEHKRFISPIKANLLIAKTSRADIDFIIERTLTKE